MDWIAPYNGFWFLMLIAFVGVAYFLVQWRKDIRKNFADAHLLPKILPDFSLNRFYIKLVLTGIVISLLILCIMQPTWGSETQEMKREGIDFVFALDVSESMNAEDIAPSRLDKAKKIISEVIEQRAGDRIGLVIFAGSAYAVSPLTNDYAALQTYLATLTTDLISFQGTDTGAALQECVNLFGTQNTAKAVVLLSDGEDHEQEIEGVVDVLQEKEIQVLAIGIGTTKATPIPVLELGTVIDYKKDFYGETVLTQLQDEQLQEIAEESGGEYLLGTSTATTVKRVSESLNSFESTQYGTTQTAQKKPIYQWLLGLALVLLFIDSLTSEKRTIR